MKKISETIVFFGSGPVAARSLELLAKNFTIETVITKPRPPHHKGDVPVLTVVEKLNIPLLTSSNKQELNELIKNCMIKSRIEILIDFGIIVSREVIDFFPLGIVNSHFSLLPLWRGADPITFAILNGDSKTGVSLMMIDEGMDTGKILTQKTYQLPKDITTPELTNNLINLSAELLYDFVPRYISGEIKPHSQPHPDRATYSRKLSKADSLIDWSKPASQIEREIRAFIGWPGSKTILFDKEVTITSANETPDTPPDSEPGDITVSKETSELSVTTSNGSILVNKLKPAGKREMTIKEFIIGYGKIK